MLAFRARYVFPIDAAAARRRGGDRSRSHRRRWLGNSVAIRDLLSAARDLGDVAILPGLINPHTHLEFSDFSQPLGSPGLRFPTGFAWSSPITARDQRRATSIPSLAASPNQPVPASPPSAKSLLLRGRAPSPCRLKSRSSANSFPFAWAMTIAIRQRSTRVSIGTRFMVRQVPTGLSPHAPYTVHPELIFQAARVSASATSRSLCIWPNREKNWCYCWVDRPVCPASGRFWPMGPRGNSALRKPLDYLQILAEAHRALVIHGNYLDDEEIDFLAAHAENMSVVYCPRTHAFFQHDPYPLAKMIAAGVNVAIGTDSRASNPDLSVLAEMRFAAARHPDVSPLSLLRMITADAAAALGRDEEIGTISPGKFADLAIMTLPPRRSRPLRTASSIQRVRPWPRSSAAGRLRPA